MTLTPQPLPSTLTWHLPLNPLLSTSTWLSPLNSNMALTPQLPPLKFNMALTPQPSPLNFNMPLTPQPPPLNFNMALAPQSPMHMALSRSRACGGGGDLTCVTVLSWLLTDSQRAARDGTCLVGINMALTTVYSHYSFDVRIAKCSDIYDRPIEHRSTINLEDFN